MALLPPGGNPKEIRLPRWRTVAAARLAAELQSMARGLAAKGAGGATVMGSTTGTAGAKLAFSRGRATGARGRTGRTRRKAARGGTVGEDRSTVADLPRNTARAREWAPATARKTRYRDLPGIRRASTPWPRGSVTPYDCRWRGSVPGRRPGRQPRGAQEKSRSSAVTMLFFPVALARFKAARQPLSSDSSGMSRWGTRFATPALMVRYRPAPARG